jgi:hypothetical protein
MKARQTGVIGRSHAGVCNGVSTRGAITDNSRTAGKFINEYADYIQQVPAGQAGRLRIGETENPHIIRRRLITAAKTINIPLIIKRSGNDLYFWREVGTQEQPRTKRRYTRRARIEEEPTALDQEFTPEE